ncbi:MAG: hypothetical protein ABIV39_07820 [Verrucomicrobiota bacterium]
MKKLLNYKGGSALLGLSFEGERLDGVLLEPANGSARIAQSFSAPLSLDLSSAEPELIAREIRNHLDAAEIRERRCVVCVPLNWAMTVQVKLPLLGEDDVANFLQIEAERGFPSSFETLSTETSRLLLENGEQFATLVAIPRSHLARLEKVLLAARLKPVGFSLGSLALQNPREKTSDGVAIIVGERITLQIIRGGGIAALRTFDGAIENESGQKKINVDFLAREMRVTLGQLPEALRANLGKVKVIGRGELARDLARDIAERLAPMGLVVELVENCVPKNVAKPVPAELSISPALNLAAENLSGNGSVLEFLPKRVRAWQQVATKFSSKKIAGAATVAGSIALLVLIAFLIQQIQLSLLRSKWRVMEPKVVQLDSFQQKIKKFRPWYDDSVRSLAILRRVTEAFPEDGQVSAKTFEVREPSAVTCSGVARDNQSFLKMLEKLRGTKEISEIKIEQVRGQSPLQFTFSFHWGGANGN